MEQKIYLIYMPYGCETPAYAVRGTKTEVANLCVEKNWQWSTVPLKVIKDGELVDRYELLEPLGGQECHSKQT